MFGIFFHCFPVFLCISFLLISHYPLLFICMFFYMLSFSLQCLSPFSSRKFYFLYVTLNVLLAATFEFVLLILLPSNFSSIFSYSLYNRHKQCRNIFKKYYLLFSYNLKRFTGCWSLSPLLLQLSLSNVALYPFLYLLSFYYLLKSLAILYIL